KATFKALRTELMMLISNRRSPASPRDLSQWYENRESQLNSLSDEARASLDQLYESASLQLLTMARSRGEISADEYGRERLVGWNACAKLAQLDGMPERGPSEEALYQDLLQRREQDLQRALPSIRAGLKKISTNASLDELINQVVLFPGDRLIPSVAQVLDAAELQKARIARRQEASLKRMAEDRVIADARSRTAPSEGVDWVGVGRDVGTILKFLQDRKKAKVRRNASLDRALAQQGDCKTWFELADRRKISTVEFTYPSYLYYSFRGDELFHMLKREPWNNTTRAAVDDWRIEIQMDAPVLITEDIERWGKFADAGRALLMILDTPLCR
ncbi:MAG: hypothetical protein AAGG01_06225, partial [Planctomycetota bacterium]